MKPIVLTNYMLQVYNSTTISPFQTNWTQLVNATRSSTLNDADERFEDATVSDWGLLWTCDYDYDYDYIIILFGDCDYFWI